MSESSYLSLISRREDFQVGFEAAHLHNSVVSVAEKSSGRSQGSHFKKHDLFRHSEVYLVITVLISLCPRLQLICIPL